MVEPGTIILMAATPQVQALQQVVGFPADGAPAVSVDERIAALRIATTGQVAPPPASGWRMSNYNSAIRLDTLEPQVAQALTRIDAFADMLRVGLAGLSARFDLLDSQRQLELAAAQVERNRNDLRDAKDELQDAALAQLTAQDKLTLATDVAQAAQIEQNRLDVLALKASDANQAAQLAAQASGIEADRLLAVAAQARADQAEADAQAAKAAAQAAQATANANAAALAVQVGRIDTAAASITTLQTNVVTAQATATAAQTAVAALSDKGQVLLGIATPASSGLLGIGNTITVPLTFPKPFPDNLYGESFVRVSGAAATMAASVTAKTATGCTLVLTNVGTVALTVPVGVWDAVFTRK